MSILRIPSVHSVHNGNYTCRAKNMAGNSSETAEIRVKVPPAWIVQPMNQSVNLYHDATLQCSADGYPLPEVTWYKQTDLEPKVIKSGHGFKILENGSLLLQNVTEDSTGQYLCEVSNGVGSPLRKASLLQISYKPHVTILKRKILEPVQKNTRLDCRATGDGPLTAKWLKDGKTLKNTSRFLEDIRLLKIHFLKSKLTAIPETVVIGSSVRKPTNTVVVTLFTVAENGPESVESLSSGISKVPFALYSPVIIIDGIVNVKVIFLSMASTERHHVEIRLSQKFVKTWLLVYNVLPSDSGVYQCVVSNKHGTGSAQIILKVLEPPGPPLHFSIKPHDAGLLLKWKEPFNGQADVTNYVIQRKFKDDVYTALQMALDYIGAPSRIGEWMNVSVPSTVTMFILQNLEKRFKHKIRLLAQNSVGLSPPSQEIAFHVDKNVDKELHKDKNGSIRETELDGKSQCQENYYNASTLVRRDNDMKSTTSCTSDADRRSFTSGYYSTVSPYAMFRLQDDPRENPEAVYDAYDITNNSTGTFQNK
ncbi:Down syndrome cell adhesion molecule-like protein Dscam2 [Nymphon striatum]|nr:Down syndrome cell adhesion molecule-like protein Dscam2 [Nymphon striatum]